MDEVILVNEQDEKIGIAEKMTAHRTGALHRALSVFIVDEENNILIQRRALEKYHSGGLWSNACCSHPRPGEKVIAAAHRRLQEEMGFDCELVPFFTLTYKADVGGGLIEHEYDHIFIGTYTGPIRPNAEEVMDYRYASPEEIQQELETQPELYTTWFRLAFSIFCNHLTVPNTGHVMHYSRS
jgi:isopentenyl-diphosphate delta-isomerase